MKKLVLLLLIITGMADAQIVNIPDVNFKARLLMANSSNSSIAGLLSSDGTYYSVGETIDTNGDGEIQISEAQRIDYLNVSTYQGSPSSIFDITGVEAFSNLKVLLCYANQIANINVSSLSKLQQLDCSYNLISNLDMNGLSNLKFLGCSSNLLTSLDFSPVPVIESVNCAGNQIATLDFSGNPNFFDLGAANNNQLTSINLRNGKIQNTGLGIMQCDGFSNCPNLTSICADENEISALQQMLSTQNIAITDCLLSNEDFATARLIAVYPNPTKDKVYMTASNTMQSIQLFNSQGRIIKGSLINDMESTVDMSTYLKGIYFLKVVTNQGTEIQRIIKE